MKIENSVGIVKAVEAEWVQIEGDLYDKEVSSADFKNFFINDKTVLSTLIGQKPLLMYCSQKNLCYAEKSFYEEIKPKRESGWYKVKLQKTFYDNKKELVVYYDSTKKYFASGCDPFDENDFEWIDDEPIKF